MLSTSHPTPAATSDPATGRGAPAKEAWFRHALFAVAYVAAVVVFVVVSYTGTSIALAWPSAGIAVWWVVTCRSRRSFAVVSAFVLFIPTLYVGLIEGRSLLTTVPMGIAYFLAGPAVGPLMAFLERMHRKHPRAGDGREVARIVAPRHVYQLLIACIILIPIAKSFSLVGIDNAGGDISVTLYLTLILRDLAGIFAVAGPGIAIFSARGRATGAAALREFGGVLALTAVVLVIIFGMGQELPIAYLAMLPLYWSATRLPVSVAAIHSLFTVGAVTALFYGLGAGPFAVSEGSSMAQASAIQLFIIMCVLLSLVVSTTVQQHSTLVAERDALTATIPDALLLVDRDRRAIPINAAAQDVVVERPDGEIVARRLREINGELLNDATRPSGRVLQGENVREMFVELVDPPERETEEDRRFYSISASPLYGPGELKPGHALLVYHDITDEYLALQELQRAHDEARALFDYAPQGVATLAADGMILQANRALGELVGLPADQLAGRSLEEFSQDGVFTGEIEAALAKPGTLVQADRCFHSGDGGERRVTLSFRTMAGGGTAATSLLVNVVDVTHQHEFYELVSHIADHDALTGLMNRRRFESDLADILEGRGPDRDDGALLLIDLDRFKAVNDLLGHHEGDDLLVEFAVLLQDCVRANDVVARLGGDEFVVVLPDADRAEATAVGERIVDAASRRFGTRTGVLGKVTASIGAAMFSEVHGREDNLLLLADQRLYDAKNSGRNRVTVAEPAQEQVERIVETDALLLELQPIVGMGTGRVLLAEGLVRVAPSAGPVSTGELVATVEKAGLGPQLDAHVMRRGIGLLPELQRARPGFRLTLNVSAQSLGSQELAGVIVAELQRHRVPPDSLVLEVTESAPIDDLDAARAFQRTLREHGVAFALDDFGAGFDPYRRLKQLDFDVVKIAGEFVESMADDDVDLSIVRSIVRLADEQDMATVAEYVSEKRIFDAVRQVGATYGQGYHIGTSLPPRAFIAEHLTGTGSSASLDGQEGTECSATSFP